MCVRKKLGNWERTVVRPESKGFGKEHLYVYTPTRDSDWPRLARSYWKGRLPDLHQKTSSPKNVIHHGRVPGDPVTYYFKRYRMRNWKDPFKHLFRNSRARRELLGGQLLLSHGFNTPKPVCLIGARILGVVRGSALITEALEGSATFHDILFPSDAEEAPSQRRKHALLKALGREVGFLHASGFIKGDLHIQNVLGQRNGDGLPILLDRQ